MTFNAISFLAKCHTVLAVTKARSFYDNKDKVEVSLIGKATLLFNFLIIIQKRKDLCGSVLLENSLLHEICHVNRFVFIKPGNPQAWFHGNQQAWV
jgi:hypothetical protein